MFKRSERVPQYAVPADVSPLEVHLALALWAASATGADTDFPRGSVVRQLWKRYDDVIPEGIPAMAVRKVAITLPEELYEMVERARMIEHRTRSELIQEALRTHFGEPVYQPTEEERRMLDEALAELQRDPESGRSWESVREEVWPRL